MRIEIDQSGRIEETQRNTVLAYSNGKNYAIKISSRTKRRLQDIFRQIGVPRTFVYNIFISAIFLLIEKDIKNIDHITIDNEYPGYEKVIARILTKILNSKDIKRQPIISFGLIGKKSKAHKKAIKVYRNKDDIFEPISYEQLVKENIVIKNGYPALKYPVD
ncbi:MAG: Uncharacterized protein CEN91_563 [Candidatus Berkelbacteria bacterium Licking1014_85]|uniref:Uncharacterized protein n=1 Tax=Candidatus Berkelbacteria bacterium Licking1014_85 TaxID=2017148 RepID=A0A554LHH0_9BACT|nr:MAG: Uncharacterized protein CEN91_563 [Candidatus Berkelbacteria bacterium Licking1014_85]